jgi:hypothetical protein
MARTKNTCPIPLIDSHLRNLENGKNKEYMFYASQDSLLRNLKKCQKKEVMSYTSLRLSLEEP